MVLSFGTIAFSGTCKMYFSDIDFQSCVKKSRCHILYRKFMSVAPYIWFVSVVVIVWAFQFRLPRVFLFLCDLLMCICMLSQIFYKCKFVDMKLSLLLARNISGKRCWKLNRYWIFSTGHYLNRLVILHIMVFATSLASFPEVSTTLSKLESPGSQGWCCVIHEVCCSNKFNWVGRFVILVLSISFDVLLNIVFIVLLDAMYFF